jgi:hypothetical protein
MKAKEMKKTAKKAEKDMHKKHEKHLHEKPKAMKMPKKDCKY